MLNIDDDDDRHQPPTNNLISETKHTISFPQSLIERSLTLVGWFGLFDLCCILLCVCVSFRFSTGLSIKESLLTRADELGSDARNPRQQLFESTLKAVVKAMSQVDPRARMSASEAERVLEFALWGAQLQVPDDAIPSSFNRIKKERVFDAFNVPSSEAMTMPEVLEYEYLSMVSLEEWQRSKREFESLLK